MLIGHGSKSTVLIWMLQFKEYHFQKFLASHSMGFMFILFPLDSWVSSIKYTDTSKQGYIRKVSLVEKIGKLPAVQKMELEFC